MSQTKSTNGIRLSEEEQIHWEQASKSLGMTKNTFIRLLLMNTKVEHGLATSKFFAEERPQRKKRARFRQTPQAVDGKIR